MRAWRCIRNGYPIVCSRANGKFARTRTHRRAYNHQIAIAVFAVLRRMTLSLTLGDGGKPGRLER